MTDEHPTMQNPVIEETESDHDDQYLRQLRDVEVRSGRLHQLEGRHLEHKVLN